MNNDTPTPPPAAPQTDGESLISQLRLQAEAEACPKHAQFLRSMAYCLESRDAVIAAKIDLVEHYKDEATQWQKSAADWRRLAILSMAFRFTVGLCVGAGLGTLIAFVLNTAF